MEKRTKGENTQNQRFVTTSNEASLSLSGITDVQTTALSSCKSTSSNESSPPDGGWGWIITISSFFVNVIIIGMHNSFGVLYLSLVESFGSSLSATAVVGSLSVATIFICAPFSGYLADLLGCRFVAIIGSIAATVGLLTSSFSPNLPLLYVTYGICYGIGTSLVYVQGALMITRYFIKKQSLASGIGIAGSSLGALIMAPLYEALQNMLGWRSAIRVVSALTSFTILCSASYRPLKKPDSTRTNQEKVISKSTKKSLESFSLWHNKAFLLWCLAIGLNRIGYLIPWVHIIKLGEDVGHPRNFGSKLIQYLGAASTISRLVIAKLVDFSFINRLYVAQFTSAGMGILCLIYAHFMNQTSVIVFAILYGSLDGGIEILMPILTLEYVGSQGLSVCWGIILAVTSIAAAGPPIGGLFREQTGSYFWSMYFTGLPMVMAAGVLTLIPCVRRTKNNSSWIGVSQTNLGLA